MGKPKICVGAVLRTYNHGKVMVLRITPDQKPLVRFLRTGTELTFGRAAILQGRISDPITPSHRGVGTVDRIPTTRYAKHIKNSWEKMITTCVTERAAPVRYMDTGTMDPAWNNYSEFEDWYMSQCNGMKMWSRGDGRNTKPTLTRSLSSLNNIHYGPNLCHVVPYWLYRGISGILDTAGYTTVNGGYRAHLQGGRTVHSFPTVDTIKEARSMYVTAKTAQLTEYAKDRSLSPFLRKSLHALAKAYYERASI